MVQPDETVRRLVHHGAIDGRKWDRDSFGSTCRGLVAEVADSPDFRRT